jgi:hypothetical protein
MGSLAPYEKMSFCSGISRKASMMMSTRFGGESLAQEKKYSHVAKAIFSGRAAFHGEKKSVSVGG